MTQGDSDCLSGGCRGNSEGQGWATGRGEDIKVPGVVWLSVHLSWILGEHLVREVA